MTKKFEEQADFSANPSPLSEKEMESDDWRSEDEMALSKDF